VDDADQTNLFQTRRSWASSYSCKAAARRLNPSKAAPGQKVLIAMVAPVVPKVPVVQSRRPTGRSMYVAFRLGINKLQSVGVGWDYVGVERGNVDVEWDCVCVEWDCFHFSCGGRAVNSLSDSDTPRY
jgi:hypothetical protein